MTAIDPSSLLLPSDRLEPGDSSAALPGLLPRDIASDANRFSRYLERATGGPVNAQENAPGDAFQSALATLRPRGFADDKPGSTLPARPAMPSLAKADAADTGAPSSAGVGAGDESTTTTDAVATDALTGSESTSPPATQASRRGEQGAPVGTRGAPLARPAMTTTTTTAKVTLSGTGADAEVTVAPGNVKPPAPASTAAAASSTPRAAASPRTAPTEQEGPITDDDMAAPAQRTSGPAPASRASAAKSQPVGAILGEAAPGHATPTPTPTPTPISSLRAGQLAPQATGATRTNTTVPAGDATPATATAPAEDGEPLAAPAQAESAPQPTAGTSKTPQATRGPSTGVGREQPRVEREPGDAAAAAGTADVAATALPHDASTASPNSLDRAHAPKDAPTADAQKTAAADKPEDTTEAPGSDTADAAPPVQTGPGPVLTPRQLQARAIRRKAVGLDGGLPGMHHKTAPAVALRRTEPLRDSNPAAEAAAASAAMAQQPVRWGQAGASTTATRIGPVAATRIAGTQGRLAALTPDPTASTSTTAPMPTVAASPTAPTATTPAAAANAEAGPARLQPAMAVPQAQQAQPAAGSGAEPALSAAPAARVASVPGAVPTAAAASSEIPSSAVTLAAAANAAPADGSSEAAPTEVPYEAPQNNAQPTEALDAATGLPTNLPGAPPEPVRLKQQEQVAEVIGAQIQAQEVHLAVVNTPESLPLEVLKAL
jgi:hypothetical protein